MPPKKGRKGKKDTKAKKKIQLTPKEEILLYQIQIKDDYLTNLKFEFSKIKEDFERVDSKLKIKIEEKNDFGLIMLEKYRALMKNYPKKVNYDNVDVINSMKSNWEIDKLQKKDVQTLLKHLKDKDENIKKLENEKFNLVLMEKDVIKDNDNQIKVLKQILDDMKGNFDAISSYLQKNHNNKKEEILQRQMTSTNNFQQKACKKASKAINDDVKKELADNQWLLEKRNVHKETFEKLKHEVEFIEEENIELNKKNYELKQLYNGFPSFYLTEVQPEEILFQEGLLEYDISDVFKYSSNAKNLQKKSKLSEQSNEINSIPELWRDYLNLYPVNFDFLNVKGNSINIKEPEPKSMEDLEEEKFTVKTLPINVKSLNSF